MSDEQKLQAYLEHRPKMRTGDVIAFSGKGRVSELIKWRTESQYSHVGMVYWMGYGEGSCMLTESTSLVNLPDAIHPDGEVIKGVQIHWISKRLLTYEGMGIWWVPLKEPIIGEPMEKMRGWIRDRHAKRIPYDTAQAIGAGIDWWDRIGCSNDPDYDKLFCSELAAKALQIGGKVPLGINPSEQTPENVVTGIYDTKAGFEDLQIMAEPVRLV
jgi:hypothetical protein